MTTVLTVLVVLCMLVLSFLLGGVYADTRELARMRRERERGELWECLEHARRRLTEVAYYYEQSMRTLEEYPDNHDQTAHVRERELELSQYMHNLEKAAVAYYTAP